MENSDALKALFQAFKARRPEEQILTDESTLPPLPDLYSTQQVQRSVQENPYLLTDEHGSPGHDFINLKLGRKGLLGTGSIDPLNASYQALLSPTGNSHIRINGAVDPVQLQYEAMLRQNGDIGAKASMPVLKGLLSLEADRNKDGNRYRMQYQRNF